MESNALARVDQLEVFPDFSISNSRSSSRHDTLALGLIVSLFDVTSSFVFY